MSVFSKFFIGAFLVVLVLYGFVVSTMGYVGVYVHYIGLPLMLTLLLLAFITRPGLFSRRQRIERTLEDEDYDYDFFDFVRDCWRVIFYILKAPFKIAAYVRADYKKEYGAQKHHDEHKNK
ncbi:hypothetical protein [Pseudomonas helleri]|uniref:Uncharacterized protein n=1 Tax=Pseudomonas helleri TaxID=1608996 RepID=A0A7X2C5V4_9PSED|nr:hypothetical protein [Pseudomonas helleri]MQT91955.1 hypothetical protein [Pseudomonas helleri]